MTRRLVTLARTDGPCASRDQPPPPPYCCPYPCPYCTLPLLPPCKRIEDIGHGGPGGRTGGLRAAEALCDVEVFTLVVAHQALRGRCDGGEVVHALLLRARAPHALACRGLGGAQVALWAQEVGLCLGAVASVRNVRLEDARAADGPGILLCWLAC